MQATNALKAQQLFEQTVSQNIWQLLWKHLKGSHQELLTLPKKARSTEGDKRVAHVALDKIIGSFNPGRTHDFYGDFRPRHKRVSERWISVAHAYLNGRSLPPVKLVHVDDAYYVLDGHHRISVAYALGRESIAADIVEN